MLQLEPRPAPSRVMSFASPVMALAITMLIGIAMFMLLGKDPVRALQIFFVEPLKSGYALSELALKATPLLLIALGLAVCFRANVWNIGAEGQFIVGAVAAGGALCGLSGAYISVVYTPLWVEGMVAGKGWIALALTTFATWRPARVLLGAYLFGGVTMLQFHLQGEGVDVPSQILSMLPYLATIVVLVLISRNAAWIRVNMPASLGKPFSPGS